MFDEGAAEEAVAEAEVVGVAAVHHPRDARKGAAQQVPKATALQEQAAASRPRVSTCS